jgi:hypothetical protein
LLRAKYPPHLPNLLPLFHVVLCLLGTTHFLHRFCLISKKTGHLKLGEVAAPLRSDYDVHADRSVWIRWSEQSAIHTGDRI